MMKQVQYIQGANGDIWIMVEKAVLLYVDPKGNIVAPNDVVAFGPIPPPP